MSKPIRSNPQNQLLAVSETPSGTLYLGTLQQAATLTLLKEYRVTAVISVGTHIPLYYQEKWGIKHCVYPYEDTDTLSSTMMMFRRASSQIDLYLREGNTLVHCTQSSLSHSASLVIAYLMLYDSQQYEKAFYYIKGLRSSINPNVTLKRHLTTFALTLHDKKFHDEKRSESPPSYAQGTIKSPVHSAPQQKYIPETQPETVEFSFQQYLESEEPSPVKFVMEEPRQARVPSFVQKTESSICSQKEDEKEVQPLPDVQPPTLRAQDSKNNLQKHHTNLAPPHQRSKTQAEISNTITPRDEINEVPQSAMPKVLGQNFEKYNINLEKDPRQIVADDKYKTPLKDRGSVRRTKYLQMKDRSKDQSSIQTIAYQSQQLLDEDKLPKEPELFRKVKKQIENKNKDTPKQFISASSSNFSSILQNLKQPTISIQEGIKIQDTITKVKKHIESIAKRDCNINRQSMEMKKKSDLWRDPEFQINKSISVSKIDASSASKYRWRDSASGILREQSSGQLDVPLPTMDKKQAYHSEQRKKKANAATLYKSFYQQ